jgi:TolB-like protein
MMRQVSVSGLIVLLVIGSSGCFDSKYRPVGPPDFTVQIQQSRQTKASGGRVVTTRTVTGLTINGHPIELVQPVSSSASRFEAETVRYGTIQFRVLESGGMSVPLPYMTKEQVESIRALSSAAADVGTSDSARGRLEMRGLPTADVGSIAVLPLEILPGHPEQEPFAEDVTEALITELAGIGAFDKVAPFDSVRTLTRSDDLPKIARDLGVEAFLVGTLQRTESRVRLVVQLIDVSANRHLWSDVYECDAREVEEVVRDVATKVSDIATGSAGRGGE